MNIWNLRTATLLIPLLLILFPAADASGQLPDHSPFTALLSRHVDDRGMVDYDDFDESPEFAAYLEMLAATDPALLPEAPRLAFWMNAYNAWTIQLINNHDERDSIKNINKALGFIPAGGPWKERMARVGGRTWTLDEIEHEIIRKEFDEPRIHFALVCAAMGCPPLRQEAYVAERLDAQMDHQARIFFTEHPDKNQVDLANRRVTLSPILDWYREDFPASDEGFGQFLARYFDPSARDLLTSGEFRIRHSDYDWSLNLQRN